MKHCNPPNSDFLNDSHLLIQSIYLKLNIISRGKGKHARLKKYFYNKRLRGAMRCKYRWEMGYLFISRAQNSYSLNVTFKLDMF